MKKFIIIVSLVVFLLVLSDMAYYRWGIYIDFNPNKPPETFIKTEGQNIYINKDGVYEILEIKGVNMGLGIPGKWATDYAIDKETFIRWFEYIKDMGANTIRVYTVLHDDFYNAFYEFNKDREDPLYLIQGVWVNDYVQNSRRDAFHDDFRKKFISDCKTVVDIIHGNKKIYNNSSYGSGRYLKDISQWVIGYILGVEWEDVTVEYTNRKYPERNRYQGKYMYTDENASPFEALLAEVGDKIIEYETVRYKQQRLVAFTNWPTTDPFDYPKDIESFFMKCAKVDVENIRTTDKFISGFFASYHVYPYYPDYLAYFDDQSGFIDEKGELNTYLAYLKMLVEHHAIPVVIAEFGVSTGRGMAQKDRNTGRNQGYMSEKDQGKALVRCFEDIREAGAAGGCVFTWQDEWFKRTWNTMHAVDLHKTPYWSDYQTNEQYFGLLSFDPGDEKSICYVDGDISEWKDSHIVCKNKNMSLSMMYDERFIYFLIHKPRFNPETDKIYIPIDTTPKTGSNYCLNYNLKFERESDFVIVIDGYENSRVLVQERYEVLRAMYYHETHKKDPYVNIIDKNTPMFKEINLMLQMATVLLTDDIDAPAEVYETGHLIYGNANPISEDFNSLADYIFNGEYIELKLPWQILNFANPSEMKIHDDYYEHYGVEYITIDRMYVGVGDSTERIPMGEYKLKGWGKKVTWHERLKSSYYILQEYWRNS